MVVGAAAAAAAATTGGTLFDYNRKNFLYDRKMRQETEYQIMEFRIRQAELWREDVRDIVGLTSVKMDTYLIVNAVQLGFCVMAFCEGRLAPGTPTWLVGCHTLSLAGAFMYLLMSIWFSMHASVTAKSYEVRLLTQHVRLPVPAWAALEGARTYSSTFEKIEARQMFRVPWVMGTQESVLREAPHGGRPPSGSAEADPRSEPLAADREGSSDLWGLEARGDDIYELDGSVRSDPHRLRHLRLVREALQYWQSYDGFARVAMSMGTNQLVTALSYYVIGYVLIANHAVVACWLAVMLFMVIAATLIRLDMSLTSLEYRVSVVLVVGGPCLLAVAAEQWSLRTKAGDRIVDVVTPLAYLMHALWLAFLLYISKVSEQAGGALLPTGFRSVMYVDVFGWIGGAASRQTEPVDAPETGPPESAEPRTRDFVPGCGPGVQSVCYDAEGYPQPVRPELLAECAQSRAREGLERQDLDPTTFVPREKEGGKKGRRVDRDQSRARPGLVPWRIFCAATTLLICLWWFAGGFVLLMSFGAEVFKVAPMLREHHGHQDPEGEQDAAFIQAAVLPQGKRLATHWPPGHIQPVGLACGEASGPAMIASTPFALYSARVAANSSEAVFAELACEGVEGELLQGAQLVCGGAGEPGCGAVVLHRQGRRLSGCSLASEAAASGSKMRWAPTASSLADMWLRNADSATGTPQEEVMTFALSDRCERAGSQCRAFVETNAHRVAEVQEPIDSREGAWYPVRTLRSMPPSSGAAPRGALSLLRAGEILASLRPEKGHVDFLRTRDGSLAGRWTLPPGSRWSAMCGAGGSIFMMTADPHPELWRFEVPSFLQAPRVDAAGPLHDGGDVASGAAALRGGPARLRRRAALLSVG